VSVRQAGVATQQSLCPAHQWQAINNMQDNSFSALQTNANSLCALHINEIHQQHSLCPAHQWQVISNTLSALHTNDKSSATLSLPCIPITTASSPSTPMESHQQ